jgi:UMF1 family MFS transporter
MMLAMLNVIANIIGGFSFGYVKRRLSLTSKTVLIITLAVYPTCCSYACIGIFAPFGLRFKPETYVFAFIVGLVNGVIQSTSRVLFADLVPVGFEAAFFSIYAISDKASSAVGPAVAGAIFDNEHVENRVIFVFLLAEALIPLICVYFFVDHRQGMIDSGRLAASEDASTGNQDPEIPTGDAADAQATVAM